MAVLLERVGKVVAGFARLAAGRFPVTAVVVEALWMIEVGDLVGGRPLLEPGLFGFREPGGLGLRCRLAGRGDRRRWRPDEPEILLAAGIDDMRAELRLDLENRVRQPVIVWLGGQAGIQLPHHAREVFGGGERILTEVDVLGALRSLG